jgi:hypothetical protein
MASAPISFDEFDDSDYRSADENEYDDEEEEDDEEDDDDKEETAENIRSGLTEQADAPV